MRLLKRGRFIRHNLRHQIMKEEKGIQSLQESTVGVVIMVVMLFILCAWIPKCVEDKPVRPVQVYTSEFGVGGSPRR
jgi:hypothetical protein